MNERPVVITTASGEQFALVERSALVRWDHATWRAHLEAVLADAGGMAQLLELAAHLGVAPDDADLQGFVARLAAALADPALCVAMFEPPPTGRPLWGRREPVTGETVRLAELARPEPTTSWVSFVLVDTRGRPFGGTSVATLHPDGTRRSVALDGAGKVTVPGLTRGDRLRVELPDASTLRWPSATSAIAPVVPGEIETRSAPGRIVALGGTERHHRIVLARQSPGFSA